MVMSPQQLVLWHKLEAFRIGRPNTALPAALPFEARLARENAWPRNYANRVMCEYRKFLFLAMTAGHPVTPSEEVDQAWHLHMVYTRSYWHDLCEQTLGKPLHHDPTAGGATEDAKFNDWYRKTLESYEKHFDQAPPRDIWPLPEDRFAPSPRKWIDTRNTWTLPKRHVSIAASLAMLAALAVLIAGCTKHPAVAPAFLLVIGIFVLLALIILLAAIFGTNRKSTKSDGSDTGSGFFWMGDGSDYSSHKSHHTGHHDTSSHHDSSSSHHDSSGCGSSSDGSSGCSSGCSGGGCGGGGD